MIKFLQFLFSMVVGVFIAAGVFFVSCLELTKSHDVAEMYLMETIQFKS